MKHFQFKLRSYLAFDMMYNIAAVHRKNRRTDREASKLARVENVRTEAAEEDKEDGGESSSTTTATAMEEGEVNGHGENWHSKTTDDKDTFGEIDVRIPEYVVSNGVKFLRQALGPVFTLDDGTSLKDDDKDDYNAATTAPESAPTNATNGHANATTKALKPPPSKSTTTPTSSQKKSKVKTNNIKSQENGNVRPEKKAKA